MWVEQRAMLGRSTGSANRIGRVLKPVQGETKKIDSNHGRREKLSAIMAPTGEPDPPSVGFDAPSLEKFSSPDGATTYRENHNSPRTTGASSHTSGVPESTPFFLAEAHFSLDNRNDKRQHPSRSR